MNLWTSCRVSCAVFLNEELRALALFLIAIYKSTFSGLVGGVCRFEPSCSSYATSAFKQYRPSVALNLTLRRLLKCHPLGPFGFDPVPKPQVQGSQNEE